MTCSDIKNLTKETLEKQYELVKLRTSNNGTYNQGSHVMQFGDLIIDEEPAADYLGKLNTGKVCWAVHLQAQVWTRKDHIVIL